MNWTVVLVFALIGAFIVAYAIAIGGSVDALGQPRDVWQRAGFRRKVWVWQALGVFFVPAAFIYSGVYLIRVRPRLTAAAGEIAVESAAAITRPPVAEAVAGPHVDRIRMGIPLSVVGAIALTLGLGCALGLTFAVLTEGSAGPLIWSQLGISLGAMLLGALLNTGFGVTLTPRDLVMRGVIRRRVAWADVRAITQESGLGAHYVRVWTRNGRGRRLRAPFAQLGVGRRRFDADFAVLQQWWLTHTHAAD